MLHRQQEWAWHNGQKFWQVTKNVKSVWNSKQDIYKILQPFWTSGHRWSYCFVQRKGHFLTVHTHETQLFWDQNLKIMWWEWIHIWYDSLFGQRQTVNCVTLHRNSCNSIRTDKENTRSWPKNCTWTITSPPQTYLMTLPQSKFTVLALSDPTGRAYHRTLGPRKWHSKVTTFKYGLGVTWQQYYGGTNMMYEFWQTFMMHRHERGESCGDKWAIAAKQQPSVWQSCGKKWGTIRAKQWVSDRGSTELDRECLSELRSASVSEVLGSSGVRGMGLKNWMYNNRLNCWE